MSFTKKEKAAVKVIVSCHETGKPVPNYGAMVVLSDDAGITFGAHQSTHKSGSLGRIVEMYCNLSTSETAKSLRPYVAGFKQASKRHIYAKDNKLKSLLKAAAKESEMKYAQDKVFETYYFEPALRAVEGSGWTTPLALAVVYDSMIQGGWAKVRDKVRASNEKDWIRAYVKARRAWLSSSSRSVVRASVYRMTTFENLIKQDNWELNTPFIVHGVKVTDSHIKAWIDIDHEPDETLNTPITVDTPQENYFEADTTGIADDVSDDVSEDTSEEDDGSLAVNVQDGDTTVDISKDSKQVVDGGKPEDTPVIIDKPAEDKLSGWKTWKTTVTAALGSVGVSLSGFIAWVWGALQDPTQAKFLIVLVIIALVIAAVYGLFYLVSRAIATASEKRRAHEILMKEMEIRSNPKLYNVKVDRRGDTSNLTDSGLPKKERNTDV